MASSLNVVVLESLWSCTKKHQKRTGNWCARAAASPKVFCSTRGYQLFTVRDVLVVFKTVFTAAAFGVSDRLWTDSGSQFLIYHPYKDNFSALKCLQWDSVTPLALTPLATLKKQSREVWGSKRDSGLELLIRNTSMYSFNLIRLWSHSEIEDQFVIDCDSQFLIRTISR